MLLPPADVAPPGPSTGQVAVVVLLVLVVLAAIAAVVVLVVRSRGTSRSQGGQQPFSLGPRYGTGQQHDAPPVPGRYPPPPGGRPPQPPGQQPPTRGADG